MIIFSFYVQKILLNWETKRILTLSNISFLYATWLRNSKVFEEAFNACQFKILTPNNSENFTSIFIARNSVYWHFMADIQNTLGKWNFTKAIFFLHLWYYFLCNLIAADVNIQILKICQTIIAIF